MDGVALVAECAFRRSTVREDLMSQIPHNTAAAECFEIPALLLLESVAGIL